MKLNYFGTDGIRGRAGEGCLTVDFLRRLGVAYARYLRETRPSEEPPRVVIGRDSRLSGVTLCDAFIEGFSAAGGECTELGITPTPSVALAVLEMGMDGGVVLTASHNPAADNGIKFFDAAGHKYAAKEEESLEAIVDRQGDPDPEGRGATVASIAWASQYVQRMAARFADLSLAGLKVVVDASCGATSATSASVLEQLGATVLRLNCEADGKRINAGIGSEHPEMLCAAVVEHAADMGLAHDGDGDRLVVCDETGVVVPGEQLLGLFATDGLEMDRARYRLLVTTLQSNLGLDEAVRAAGGEVIRTDIGDRNVLQEMLVSNALIGGENSGHYIFLEDASTGDGLVAALHLLRIMTRQSARLSELRSRVALYPQRTATLAVVEKPALESLPELTAEWRRQEAVLGQAGRVFIRYSGTESKLRFLVEGPVAAVVEAALDALIVAARADFAHRESAVNR